MDKREKKILIIVFVLLVVSSIVSLKYGSKIIDNQEMLKAFITPKQAKYGFIVYEYRVPRLLLTIIVGMALGTAGSIFQGVLRNPLASTDVLGVSKGAGLGACIVLAIPGIHMPLPLAAIAGGLGATALLFFLTRKSGLKGTSIVVMGIAISALCDAGIQYLNVTEQSNIQAALTWLTGTVWGRYWDEVLMILPCVLVLIPIAMGLANKLNILALGDAVAINLGERVGILKVVLLITAVLLTAVSVSVSGTIGFVGLIAPHMAGYLGGTNYKVKLPLAGMVGSLLLVITDTIGRTLWAPLEVPVGIMTAIIGAPYFIYLLLRKKVL